MIQLDTDFYDLTCTKFGLGGPNLAKFRYSGGNSPECPDRQQVVIWIATAYGVPTTDYVLPGNTAGKAILADISVGLNNLLYVDGTMFIADRELLSSGNLHVLEAEDWNYILAPNRSCDNDIAEIITQDDPNFEDMHACVVKETVEKRYLLSLSLSTPSVEPPTSGSWRRRPTRWKPTCRN